MAYFWILAGPGTNYPVYGGMLGGTQAQVIGVSEDGKWWMVRISPEQVGSGFGRVSADWTQATNTSDVPVISAPGAGYLSHPGLAGL